MVSRDEDDTIPFSEGIRFASADFTPSALMRPLENLLGEFEPDDGDEYMVPECVDLNFQKEWRPREEAGRMAWPHCAQSFLNYRACVCTMRLTDMMRPCCRTLMLGLHGMPAV